MNQLPHPHRDSDYAPHEYGAAPQYANPQPGPTAGLTPDEQHLRAQCKGLPAADRRKIDEALRLAKQHRQQALSLRGMAQNTPQPDEAGWYESLARTEDASAKALLHRVQELMDANGVGRKH